MAPFKQLYEQYGDKVGALEVFSWQAHPGEDPYQSPTAVSCSTASFGSPAHRRPLARPTRALPALPDLPSALLAVDRSGRARRSSPGVAEYLKERGGLDLSECFIDGTFVDAEQGRIGGKDQGVKGTKLMALADAPGVPVAVHAASASPHEVTLVVAKLAASFAGEEPKRLTEDRTYGSDLLDAGLAQRGVEVIAPQQQEPQGGEDSGRAQTQALQGTLEDRAALHLTRELPVLVVRYERRAENYLAFVQLGCVVTSC